MKIKDWAVEDRPREKLVEKGAGALTNSELLGIVLGSGSTTETAVELASRILSSTNNDLLALGNLSLEEFKTFKGVGEAKAVGIVAALELAKRRGEIKTSQQPIIRSSSSAFDLMKPKALGLQVEKFWLIHLNRANQVQEISEISVGGVSQTVVDLKVVFKEAVVRLSSALILCHNHPSGNLTPSEADKELTSKVRDGAQLFNISLLDHIIVSDSGYFSFSDEGLI